MSKKSFVVSKLVLVGAKENENGHYELTMEQFYQLDAELGNEGFDHSICNNKIDESLKAIYDGKKKNKYVVLKIVKTAKKEIKKAEKTGRTHKVSSVKIGDTRIKIIEVKTSKGIRYEMWSINAGKRKMECKSESLEEVEAKMAKVVNQ